MIAYRVPIGLRYAKQPAKQFASWLLTSREHTNFTYNLSPTNRRYLAAFVANVTGVDHRQALAYMDELENDQILRDHIQAATDTSDLRLHADRKIGFGRRAGWYAFVRILKPSVVVETGVDKGLGACALTAALKRNSEEGHPGYYYGTDINPSAGYLLRGPYLSHGQILYGDSVESLKSLDAKIDMFVNDSDHSAAYEGSEYRTIENKLTPHAIIIGDNAHVTDELINFADQTHRAFHFFREQPHHHWYPGAGIGIAHHPRTTATST